MRIYNEIHRKTSKNFEIHTRKSTSGILSKNEKKSRPNLS